MKRKLILIVFVLTACLLIPYADINDLAISLDAPDDVIAGEDVEVELSITDNPGIVGMTFKIEYNENLKLESYQVGDVLALPVEPTKLTSQTLFYFDVGESLQQSTATGQLIKFVFSTTDAKQAETGIINIIEIEAVNESDQIVQLTSQGRVINILGESNQPTLEPTPQETEATTLYSEPPTEPKSTEPVVAYKPQTPIVQPTTEPLSKPIAPKTPTTSPEPIKDNFSDVSATDWYYADVNWCYQKKLMNGTSEKVFSAEKPMTRAMLVTVLYRLAGQPVVLAQNTFSDVDTTDYYNKAVNWAVQNGIITGYNSDVFGADDNVTRQQIATILYRYSKVANIAIANLTDLSANYNDAEKISDYAKDGLNYCIQQGVLSGKPGNLLDPQNKATRAEVATMLHRFAKSID